MSEITLDLGDRSATISDDGLYRYDLTRTWGPGPRALWVLLNPSVADALKDDPTTTRCIGFSRREGCGSLTLVNLYAYRATKPRELRQVDDPVGGYRNRATIEQWLQDPSTSFVVAGWGATRVDPDAVLAMQRLVREAGHSFVCLGTTKSGAPRHPLYLKTEAPFIPWSAP